MRLKRVDFPTLGRPTMTTVGVLADMNLHDSSPTLPQAGNQVNVFANTAACGAGFSLRGALAPPWSLAILVESEVGQTIGLCRLSPAGFQPALGARERACAGL